MNIAYVSNSPFPYHTPIINELSEIDEVQVVYMSLDHPLGSYIDNWGQVPKYRYQAYWSKALAVPLLDIRTQWSIGVSRLLSALEPDVVLFSSWGPLVLEPLLWKTVRSRRAIMWAESTSFSGLLRDPVSNMFRKIITGVTDAFVANGSCAKDFLEDLGVHAGAIIQSCLPSPLGIGGRTEFSSGRPSIDFLYVGRLIPRKRPTETIEAFERLIDLRDDVRLRIVGDGPLEQIVRNKAATIDSIEYLGRKEGDELAKIYMDSDILVMPSTREVWGLVVNEALAFGLYVIASDEVGSAHDLIDGRNGRIVPADDSELLREAMMDACDEVDRSAAARLRRSKSILHCTPRRFAEDIHAAGLLALDR